MKNLINNLPLNIKENQKFLISLNLSIGLAIFSILLIKYLFNKVPNDVPIWYTKPWGREQTAERLFLYTIPLLQIIFTLINSLVMNYSINKRRNEYVGVFSYLGTFTNLSLFAFLLRILSITTFFPFSIIDPRFLQLVPPFLLSLLISLISGKFVIKLAKKFDIVTNPQTDTHPAMLINRTVPRAGALAFYIGFIATSLLFLPLNSKKFIGIYVGTTLAIILGILDDKFKDINRYLRLILLSGIAAVTSLFGVLTFYLNNPFGGALKLDIIPLQIEVAGSIHKIFPIAVIFSIVWIIWVMNTISWSNGIDGQFAGIAGITALTIALLSLRFAPTNSENINVATLAIITAGAVFGLTPYTWYPMKIMWGFGATAVGLVLASISILSVSKVAVASLVLLVPFLDALFAIIRRISRKKSPFFGDREHFHHKLLDMRWTMPQIAIFYWVVTFVLGTLALLYSDKGKILTLITFGGIFGFILIIFNLFNRNAHKT